MNEKELKARNGMPALILFIGLYALAAVIFAFGIFLSENAFLVSWLNSIISTTLIILSLIWLVCGFIPFMGLRL